MSVTLMALARYTLKGPYQAASVVGSLAVLAVLVPLLAPSIVFSIIFAALLTVLSCSLVGLIILTQGTISGLKAIAVSVLGITLVTWAILQLPELGLRTGIVQWLPVIVLAQTLRSSKSLALTILAGVLIGSVGVAIQQLGWIELDTSWVSIVIERMGQAEELQQELEDKNVQLAQLLANTMIAMAFLVYMLIVLGARWMQARMADSDGFGKEFLRLSLGKPAAAIALVVVLLSFLVREPWLISLAFLIVIAFMFQGIAVVHDRLAAKTRSGLFLGLFYALLWIFPQVVALTSITGLIDNWLGFRKKSDNPNDININ